MDDDQEICRVCRSESTPDHPLYHPCKCSGSIRFVHEDCLIEWLSHSRKKYCELCDHPFKFSPIYREDMPERVPMLVFCSQLIHRSMSFLKTLLRALTVVFVWLVILPSFTLWTWRFYFWSGEHIGFNTISTHNTTSTEEKTLAPSALKSFLSDCLEGQIITAFVIIIFVAAYLFREWVMQNLPADDNHQQQPVVEPVLQRGDEQQQLVQEQVAIDTLLNAMQVINPPERRDPEHEYIHHLEHQLGGIRNEIDNELNSRHQESAVHNNNDHHDNDEEENEEEDLAEEELDHDAFLRMFNEHINRRREELIQRDMILAQLDRPELNPEPPVAAPAPNNNHAAVEENEEPFEVADDMNGVLEAIGMRGNPWMLVQNSVLMSLMISLCLGLAVWIPYVVGRLMIMIRPISFIETPIYILRFITDPLVDFVLDTCIPSIWSIAEPYWKQMTPQSIQSDLQLIYQFFLKEAVSSTAVMDDSTDGMIDWNLIQSKIETTGSMALERWHQFALGQTALDRTICILMGYFVFICLGSWYLAHGKRRMSAVQDLIRQQGIFLKVLFFIVIELVVFPTVCGFLLDFATLPLFVNASIETRYGFHLKSPYSSYFLHWFLGTGVLFYFAIFITVSREIIRPGVMWFVRDPNDPQFHPVQEMVERPFRNLLYKISQSALMYSTMLVFGVGTVTYTLAMTGVVFPLRLPFNKPLSTLALDLLVVQFLLPPLVQLVNPRENSKKALAIWWHFACRQLRLTSFMFNERQPDEEGHHVRKSWKAIVFRKKAKISEDEYSEVAIDDESSDVVFQKDGMLVRVPKYDSVPVDPKRRMLVPVDPVTLEAIDEEERRRGHPAAADTGDEAQSTIVVYIPPHFKLRTLLFLLFMWLFISLSVCSVTVVPYKVLVGRLLFKIYLAPHVDVVNDLYSFALGFYLMVGISLITCWLHSLFVDYESNGFHLNVLMDYTKRKAEKASRCLYLIFTLAVMIPLLLGVSVDLFVFMPIRSYYSKEIVIDLSQNWSFGIVYLSIFYHAISLLPTQNRIRVYLDSVFGNHLLEADLDAVTRKVIVPVTMTTLLFIILPGILSWILLQMTGSQDDGSFYNKEIIQLVDEGSKG
ncbi:hypothetical protein G6F61_004976 [Rhizopus arrhizus]|uniref:RING-type E3 ubiquitin transferase n=1 Tax=Rhizopus oryzae TaxID=64495 RepID=A0A9P7BSF4_RHIOR|nr:hypothetical protein G6F23_006906 [Rhizopus arrhizus]KAG1299014.1 hypothetical protein G6F66_001188 [Rhizopus arrhizus]KAG1308020.1 hypothetical protein G6F64_006359 [Rhizopus arrhizus]KAG1379407.1 hypothetical protein G6F61_004976 [Rhizopus arrhizus]